MFDWFTRVIHFSMSRYNFSRVTVSFETTAPNDSKKTLSITTSNKVPKTCGSIDSVPNPQFQSVSLYCQPFSRYRPFVDKCTENDLQMTLNIIRSKVSHIFCTCVP